MDAQADESLAWIAEHAANVSLPADWVEIDDNSGGKAYYHPKTKRVQRRHPVLAKYRQFIKKMRQFRERAGTAEKKVRPHMAVILNEVMNRCHRELPPVTPEILERTAALLGVDTAVDQKLATRIKRSIESLAEEQYDIAVRACDKADIDGFLRSLREEQIAMEVLNKPDGVIMCSEFEDIPACVKCDQCMDYFSLEGFARTHHSGKRKEHTTVKCEQVACSVHRHEFATCEVEGRLLCDRAYEEIVVQQPLFRQKRRRFLGGLFCSEYEGRRAEVLCEDCPDLFCWEAFIELHNHGHRREHSYLQLDASGQPSRQGVICPPEEAEKLLSRVRLARDGGAWLAFRDDQLNAYWYHLCDKVVTKENPYLGSGALGLDALDSDPQGRRPVRPPPRLERSRRGF